MPCTSHHPHAILGALGSPVWCKTAHIPRHLQARLNLAKAYHHRPAHAPFSQTCTPAHSGSAVGRRAGLALLEVPAVLDRLDLVGRQEHREAAQPGVRQVGQLREVQRVGVARARKHQIDVDRAAALGEVARQLRRDDGPPVAACARGTAGASCLELAERQWRAGRRCARARTQAIYACTAKARVADDKAVWLSVPTLMHSKAAICEPSAQRHDAHGVRLSAHQSAHGDRHARAGSAVSACGGARPVLRRSGTPART